MAGTSFWHFWLALIFLGVGWNFGFIGSTSLVASASRPDERGIVQGTNDMLVLGMVTFASFMSGQLLDGLGWNFVNILVFPLCTTAIISLMWLTGKEKALPINK
jgi:MFS family permease